VRRRWQGWVALWDHHEHPRSLALIRIGLGLCLLWDYAWMALLGLVVPILGAEGGGGWARVADRGSHVPLVWQVLPETPGSAWLIWAAVVVCILGVVLGVAFPVSALGFVLLSAQTAQTLDAADRGIDTLIRNVMLLLAFSGAARTWSVDAWWRTGSWRGDGRDVPAWPRHLLIVQLVIMYFIAGIAKIGSGWTPLASYSALYVILQDVAVTRFDWSFLAHPVLYRITQICTAVTISWEYSSPLVLLMYWYRHTPDRPGRLRAFANRHRLHWWWLAVGVIFHVLIAVSLNLGIFPFAMLALYPCFVHPDEWWWVRKDARASEAPDVVGTRVSTLGA
jgi:hypothetical protein